MSDKIKEILAKRRNPDLAVLTKIEDIRNDALKLIDKAVTERFSALEDQIKTLIDNKETKSDQDLIEQTTLKLLKNVKGEEGEKGESGDKGDKGDSIQGDQGIQGEKGEKGDKGDKGDVGLTGLNGNDGLNGKDGKDGSPDKPEEVAKKLNTLEEIVEMKVIKGLKDYLKKLETNIFYKGSGKSGGGGMGQPQHETFAVDSTTTSITTAYEIAADGRAIFGLRYQGQTLHWGEHYTVSGKVITILETLGDNTNLDITYIRK